MNDPNSIYAADYAEYFPDALKRNRRSRAVITIISDMLRRAAREIKKINIFGRIDELSEDLLDILAYDLHVDWYSFEYPLTVKLAIIKDSILVHKFLGTRFAVETALGNVIPGAKVFEWFKYDGRPYTFRLVVDVESSGLSQQLQEEVFRLVDFYKNLRSHFEGIVYQLEMPGDLYIGAHTILGRTIKVYPKGGYA